MAEAAAGAPERPPCPAGRSFSTPGDDDRPAGYDTRSLAGKTLVEVLLDPRADLGLLRAVKECCKRLSLSLDSRAEAAIATTLYYAAMASALVYHDKKITRHSEDTLDEAFGSLIEKPWMASELAGCSLRPGTSVGANGNEMTANESDPSAVSRTSVSPPGGAWTLRLPQCGGV